MHKFTSPSSAYWGLPENETRKRPVRTKENTEDTGETENYTPACQGATQALRAFSRDVVLGRGELLL